MKKLPKVIKRKDKPVEEAEPTKDSLTFDPDMFDMAIEAILA